MGKIYKLTPALSFKIWGGQFLQDIKKVKGDLPLGETWEISTHPDGSSKQEDKNLSDFMSLNYLFKYIDTQDNLSVQVHPDDKYAKEYENQSGKTECWIILKAQKDAGIYLGLKDGITKKEFQTALNNGLAVDHYLNFIPVKPGDYFYVPAGSIHAIGKGVTLAETQQSSGITYRVWDWNRVDDNGKGRALHIKKAMDVIRFDKEFNQKLFYYHKNVFIDQRVTHVLKNDLFKIDILTLKKEDSIELNLSEKDGVSVLAGSISIDDETYNIFDSAIIMDSGTFKLKAHELSRIILISP